MKICFVFLFLTISMAYIARAAVPINQYIVDAMYCNNSLPFNECNIRVQRKSKTAQSISGNLTIKSVWSNDISLMLTVSYLDYSGVWKGLIMKNVHNTCDAFFTKGGMFYDQRNKFFVGSKDGCPLEPTTFEIGPAIVNRYRKDWEADLKALIPPYWMEADKWRSTGAYYHKDDPETIIGEASIEFRLINEHMSQ